MTDRIDNALQSGLLTPPDDFVARVMADISQHPLPVRSRRVSRGRALIEWLALAGAVVTGLAQLLPFLFGVWTISNAG